MLQIMEVEPRRILSSLQYIGIKEEGRSWVIPSFPLKALGRW